MSSRMHDLTTTARALTAGGRRVGFARGIESSAGIPPASTGVGATQ